MISFVCSIGNIPLAAVLWNGGLSFGGVVSFIFADLIVIPVLLIYRKYYGMRMALFLFATFYAAMAGAGYIIEILFGALGLIPTERNAQVIEAQISWTYTTWLNIAFLILAAVPVVRFLRTGGLPMLHMMGGGPDAHDEHDHSGHDHSGRNHASHAHHAQGGLAEYQGSQLTGRALRPGRPARVEGRYALHGPLVSFDVGMGSHGLDDVDDGSRGAGRALLVGDQSLVICAVDGAVGAVGRQGRQVVLGRYVGGRATDAGCQDDQGLVGEAVQSCGLLGGGVALDELVDGAAEVVRGGEAGAHLSPRLRGQAPPKAVVL